MALSLLLSIILSVCFSRESVVHSQKVKSHVRSIEDRSLQTVVGKVDKLILYDAIADLPILTLTDGMVVDTATLSNVNHFSVVATTINGTVGSVRFGYNGKSNARTELSTPYSLCGDTGTNLKECAFLVVGRHSLTVTTYEGIKANGTIVSVEKLSFQIGNNPQQAHRQRHQPRSWWVRSIS